MKRSKSGLVLKLIFVLIVVAVVYVYTSSMFERVGPNINMSSNGYWNLKKPLNIDINDASGVKSYTVILRSKSGEKVLYKEKFITVKGSLVVEVEPPRSAYAMKDKDIKIVVQATDASKWNFLKGNTSIKEFELKIDKKRPEVTILSHSYKIN
jgi:archaellum component FlaF (FlaF/FlaG flagellin family)